MNVLSVCFVFVFWLLSDLVRTRHYAKKCEWDCDKCKNWDCQYKACKYRKDKFENK